MPEEKSAQSPEEKPPDADHEDNAVPRFPLGDYGADKARGEIQDITIISRQNVPKPFSRDIETLEALEIQLFLSETGDEMETTYLPWPATGPSEEFRRLAALAEIPPERPEELIGARILLRSKEGNYVPLLPERQSRGYNGAVYGAWAGLAPSISIALFSFFGMGALVESFLFFVLWGVGTFVVLPLSVYLDAWNLRGQTDFEGSPVFWAIISALPPLYVITAPYYLLFVRQNALPMVSSSDTESGSTAAPETNTQNENHSPD